MSPNGKHDGEPLAGSTLERTGLLAATPEPELDRWTAGMRRYTGAAAAAVLLFDGDRVVAKSLSTVAGTASEVTEVPSSVSRAEYLLGAAGSKPQAAPEPAYLEHPISIERQTVGVICVADPAPRPWSEDHRRALGTAADSISTEIRLRLASEQAVRVEELLRSHNKVHELIAQGAPLKEVLMELIAGIERHDPSVAACVVLLDQESSTLHPGAGPSLPPDYLAAIDGVVIGPNVGTCGSAAWSGRLTITDDMATDPKWAPIRDWVVQIGLRHCWSMPIKSSEGNVLGTLALYGPKPREPLPEHLTLMADGARMAGIAIERHRTLERLIHDARHDGLTGLPNRTAIFEQLDDALLRTDSKQQVAVLFIDLDGLKSLNDTLGHDRADEMLREISERLSSAVRADDFVGRFGGDEFVVIAEGVKDDEEAAELGFRLLDSISEPLPGVKSTTVTASIGISLMTGTGIDAREAIRQADSAMYTAKRSGRDRCVFFEGSQRIRTGRRLALARELRGAEMRGEMRLVFQPVTDLATSETVAVEALLRWSSPSLGEVSPAEFIPVAEDMGAIIPIGAWVLRESCETMARVNAQLGRSLELGVNVSAHQIANPGFALSVQQTLHHAEFPAELLTLEITETALMRPDTVTARTLHELEALGVRIVLDDFGTGFSSLCWLKDHPLDAIKVDQSFVAGLPDDPRDRAIVAAVIEMAKALGCTVTAEGVETDGQLTALRALDCERVQGFLLARPAPIEQLTAQLGERIAA
ncbi:MAG: EAL domain-containing protein [Solirubrobacterales bacterium]|nr:EAL domain-containing protein [Solirubrobacterales bacterium]